MQRRRLAGTIERTARKRPIDGHNTVALLRKPGHEALKRRAQRRYIERPEQPAEGGFNAVVGGDGNVTVTGAPDGYTAVTLGNGNNQVSGTQGMAFITTGSGNDKITLGDSGRKINAGGSNIIVGGTGHDTLLVPKASQGFDSITGFTEANNDVFDLKTALAATNWNHKAATLGNHLKVADSRGNATLSIAPTDSGAATAIATLNGAGNLGLPDLLSHPSLLTGQTRSRTTSEDSEVSHHQTGAVENPSRRL